jgi:hypothetical protein
MQIPNFISNSKDKSEMHEKVNVIEVVNKNLTTLVHSLLWQNFPYTSTRSLLEKLTVAQPANTSLPFKETEHSLLFSQEPVTIFLIPYIIKVTLLLNNVLYGRLLVIAIFTTADFTCT